MAQFDYLFVGLGNPGFEYADTRHNIGWMIIEEFAKKRGLIFIPGKGNWREFVVTFAGKKLLFIEPLTYMNLSGTAAIKCMRQNDIMPSNVICIADEYNFPVGRIQLKQGGSDGGHNGISSMIKELQTPNFWRMRCGIAKNFEPGGMADYVLSPFASDEKQNLTEMLAKGCTAIELIAKGGLQRAMQTINAENKSRMQKEEKEDLVSQKT